MDIVRWCTIRLENFVVPVDAFRNERARNCNLVYHQMGNAVFVENLGEKGDLSGYLHDWHGYMPSIPNYSWQLRVDMLTCKGVGSGEVCESIMIPVFWRSTGSMKSLILWADGSKESVIVEMGKLVRTRYYGHLAPQLFVRD